MCIGALFVDDYKGIKILNAIDSYIDGFPLFFFSDGNYECRISILSICLGLHAHIHAYTRTHARTHVNTGGSWKRVMGILGQGQC